MLFPPGEFIMGNNRKYLKFCEVCKEDVEHKVWYPYLKGGNVCGGCVKEYVKSLNASVNTCKDALKEIKLLKLKVNELQDDLEIERSENLTLKKKLEYYKDY
jgi:hypothetical protein